MQRACLAIVAILIVSAVLFVIGHVQQIDDKIAAGYFSTAGAPAQKVAP